MVDFYDPQGRCLASRMCNTSLLLPGTVSVMYSNIAPSNATTTTCYERWHLPNGWRFNIYISTSCLFEKDINAYT